MAQIKSYTDIEQSKKLSEILPLESADMEYLAIKENGKLVGSVSFVKDTSEVEDSVYSHIYERIACWSLSALLSVLPDYTLQTNADGTVFVVCDSKKPMISDAYDNPVDACYEMIIRLNELKML